MPVGVVRPLRREVLRPGRPPEESVYAGDDDGAAVHAAVRDRHDGTVVAVGSLLAQDPPAWLRSWPGVPSPSGAGRWWRIRGMATAEPWRNRGLGRAVLSLLLLRAAEAGGGTVWCNARLAALGLYRRAGFTEAGETFEISGIGPHRAMWRVVPGPEQTPPSPEPRSSNA